MCFWSTNGSYWWWCPSWNYSPNSYWVSLFLFSSVLTFCCKFMSYIQRFQLAPLSQIVVISHSDLRPQKPAHCQCFHLFCKGRLWSFLKSPLDHVESELKYQIVSCVVSSITFILIELQLWSIQKNFPVALLNSCWVSICAIQGWGLGTGISLGNILAFNLSKFSFHFASPNVNG